MPRYAIVVEALEKYFPPAHSGWRALLQPIARPTLRALAAISFFAEPAEALALVGENGAGKSTLLRVLATLLLPTHGRAEICGADVARDAAGARSHIGYDTGVEEGFYGRLTGRDNLRLFAALNNISSAQVAQRIRELSDLLGLHESLDRQARTYSTGTLQRLGLARALVHSPSVLLLDEPTRSLDPLAATDFRRFLKTEILGRRGTTLLFASHSLAEVEELSDRIILLDHGEIRAIDTAKNLCLATKTSRLEDAVRALAPPRAASAPTS
ncbi:MAG: ABC transporter ATP-binding protein [Candidatus Acidiferrales bacterium]